MQQKILLAVTLAVTTLSVSAQAPPAPTQKANTRFEQLGPTLPTPSTFRTASGSPGKDYFQNRADYDIKVALDDTKQKLTGSETITYRNNSGDALPFLWLQLDQNLFRPDADGNTATTSSINAERGASMAQLNSGLAGKDYGYNITSVRDQAGKALKFTINQTMMRVDLPVAVGPGKSVTFSVDWNFQIVDANATRARSGYEFFAKDGNYIYEIAQWFPRLCAYSDVYGWQNKQFLGQGEFTLIFGNYKVAVTAPADHVVGATGELQNPNQVLTATQQKRWNQAKTLGDKPGENPVAIVTQAEAEAAEKAGSASKSTGTKTWIYKADNVRDFAFASSRKFIWDALNPTVEGKRVWAMSLYPKEANPLWGQYSTRLVIHTLRTYSRRTIAYPYPVAYSVHGPVGGMEYPMMSFNGARPEADGTYPVGTKNFLISVVIHEVGHNFFPMIVNSDERQWSWMDEGLNSFLEGLSCLEWDANFPARGIDPQSIVPYMQIDSSLQVPIMSSSDNIPRNTFGPNAYTKPATALNILRETVMGRELFDYAFKEYAHRWAFKTPEPADFFRTMEDASGVDLDWFWKGWFYGVQPVDQSLAKVDWFQTNSQNPEVTKTEARAAAQRRLQTVSKQRDAPTNGQTVVAQDSTMRDFYNQYDPYAVTTDDKKKYQDYLATLSADERALTEAGTNFYTLSLKNKGGLPMPVIVRMQFEDGTDSVARFPAEIWRFNDVAIKKVITTNKKVTQWTLDPFYEIADINTDDNTFPPVSQPTRFQLFKQQGRPGAQAPNPMQQQRRATPPPAVQGSGRN